MASFSELIRNFFRSTFPRGDDNENKVVLSAKKGSSNTLKNKVLKGVSTMNQSKDRALNPRTRAEKVTIIRRAKELGAEFVFVETPFSFVYIDNTWKEDDRFDRETAEWINVIRDYGLKVGHRHTFLQFEGLYGYGKTAHVNYIEGMRIWMRENAELLQNGDLWLPIPEPQNAGIYEFNCQENCVFENIQVFNKFVRDLHISSKEGLLEIKKSDIQVIVGGFDGFLSWGDNNPDWAGKSFLEPLTLQALGYLSIDHYPQKDKDGRRSTWEEDLKELRAKWPQLPLYITEFGKIDSENPISIQNSFQSFQQDPLIKGIFYWQIGPSGPESLLNQNFTPTQNFYEVQKGFQSLR